MYVYLNVSTFLCKRIIYVYVCVYMRMYLCICYLVKHVRRSKHMKNIDHAISNVAAILKAMLF